MSDQLVPATTYKWTASIHRVALVDGKPAGLIAFKSDEVSYPLRWCYFSPLDDMIKIIMEKKQLDLEAAVDFFNEESERAKVT